MRISLIISIIIHVVVIALCYFGIGGLFSERIKDSGHVVFDFVEIGPKSKAPMLSQVEGKTSKTKAQTPEDQTITALNQPSESAPRKEEKNPELKKKEEAKKEPPKDEKVVPIKDKKAKPTKKEPKKKQEQKSQKNITQTNSKALDNSVVNLNRNKKSKANIDPKSAKKSFNSALDSALAKDDNENTGIKAEEVGAVLTATQIDLIVQTIRKCWHFPAGLKNAEDLIVDIKMELDPKGNVKKAQIMNDSSDPNFKIAAENAYRAVLDPACSPLPLPPEKYEEWKELELSFNPKDMFR